MSAFKDMVAADIDSTFLNLDEFAEPVDVDGVMVDAVLDESLTDKPDMGLLGTADFAEGVYRKAIHMFVRLSALGYLPSARQHMHVNGKWHIVTSVTEDMGLLEVLLEVNDS